MVAGLVVEFSAYHASKPQIPTESGKFSVISNSHYEKNLSADGADLADF
jgi:hypothetical protein